MDVAMAVSLASQAERTLLCHFPTSSLLDSQHRGDIWNSGVGGVQELVGFLGQPGAPHTVYGKGHAHGQEFHAPALPTCSGPTSVH